MVAEQLFRKQQRLDHHQHSAPFYFSVYVPMVKLEITIGYGPIVSGSSPDRHAISQDVDV